MPTRDPNKRILSLAKEIADLGEKLQARKQELTALLGAGAPKRRGRPAGKVVKTAKGTKRDRGLSERVLDLLKKSKRPLTIAEIAKKVGAKNINSLSTTLYNLKKEGKVKRVGKDLWAAKGASGKKPPKAGKPEEQAQAGEGK